MAGRDKEKVEKRRALGRGLESLLPGPRVVPGTPGQSGGAAGKQQVPATPPVGSSAPHSSVHAVRPVTHFCGDSLDCGCGEAFEGTIRAVVDEAVERGRRHIHPPQHSAAATAELRSAGQPGAAVPTLEAGEAAEADEPITIYAQAESRMPANLVVNLEIADIDKNPFQTRYVDDDEALEELADSIKANGVVQPIMVRPSEDEEGRYILVLGRAAAAGFEEGGEDDDSGDGAARVAAAGGGDDDRREPAARGFERARTGGSVPRVEQRVFADAGADWRARRVVAGVDLELHAAAEAAARGDAAPGGKEDHVSARRKSC